MMAGRVKTHPFQGVQHDLHRFAALGKISCGISGRGGEERLGGVMGMLFLRTSVCPEA
jgi:hypothetical protein